MFSLSLNRKTTFHKFLDEVKRSLSLNQNQQIEKFVYDDDEDDPCTIRGEEGELEFVEWLQLQASKEETELAVFLKNVEEPLTLRVQFDEKSLLFDSKEHKLQEEVVPVPLSSSSELESLHQKLDSEKRINSALIQELNELQTKLKESKATAGKVEDLESKVLLLQSSLKDRDTQLSQCQDHVQQLESQIKEKTSSYDQAQEQIRILQSHLQTLQQTQTDQLAQQKQQEEKLQQQLESEIQQSRALLTQKESQIASLQQANAMLQLQLEHHKEEFENQMKSLEQQLRRYESLAQEAKEKNEKSSSSASSQTEPSPASSRAQQNERTDFDKVVDELEAMLLSAAQNTQQLGHMVSEKFNQALSKIRRAFRELTAEATSSSSSSSSSNSSSKVPDKVGKSEPQDNQKEESKILEPKPESIFVDPWLSPSKQQPQEHAQPHEGQPAAAASQPRTSTVPVSTEPPKESEAQSQETQSAALDRLWLKYREEATELESMGFPRHKSLPLLEKYQGNLYRATNDLLAES